MNNRTSESGGITFIGLLAIVFITLKLCNVITWSWWWVLSPLWIPFAIVVAFVVLFGIAWLAKIIYLAIIGK